MRGERARLTALGTLTTILAGSAVATGLVLRLGDDPLEGFTDGRLSFPVSYVNGQAAFALVAFWPAVVFAARRAAPVLLRALALGGATALLADWLLTQSKGGAVALVASAVLVFAFGPGRLRLVLPASIPALLVLIAFDPLTEPFRTRTEPTVRHAGEVMLLLFVSGVAVGAVLAVADRRLGLGPRARRAAGAVVLTALAVSLTAAAAAFFVRVDDPADFADEKWEAFKQLPDRETGGSHLVNLGSNRYDFWRVSLGGFRDHPVAGVGGRGFGTVYLQERRADETPARAHSLPLDVALESGAVGLVLLVAALGAALASALRRTRAAWRAAVLGGASYWLVHACGDWIWTLPAAGIPFFLLLGIAASASTRGRLRPGIAVAGGLAVATAGVLLFAPPWLSARMTQEALRSGSAADLDWARRLDPLSVEPLLAEAALAPSPAARTRVLRRALEREPRSAALHYLLGLALLEDGRTREARTELQAAHRLDPRDELIANALSRSG
ncbi:MAG: O-antigen ligase family protein [Gaiellaceae bacterium]